MASWSDKLVGSLLMLVAIGVFLYYSVWVLILPFVEPGHLIHTYFLPRYYAIVAPITLGVILMGLIGVFVSIVMIQQRAKKAAKKTH